MFITIPGKPIPNESHRTFLRGRKVMRYDPLNEEKSRLRGYIRRQVEMVCPDWRFPEHPEVTFIFHMPIPKSMPKKRRLLAEQGILKHTNRPDGDNMVKLYLDCIKDIAFGDDATVQLKGVYKVYPPEPKINIFIEHGAECIDPAMFPFLDDAPIQ